ncbi:MAG: hypothetical protein E7404_00140 [Ruminococcaceae bacterium]|nr:hypothetical protein [Oscillospiraceae bacterium]
MLTILFKSVIVFLACYALIDIVRRIISAVFSKEVHIKDDVFVVIKIKNKNENIEGVVRSVIWKSLSTSGGSFVPSILIVDMGSDEKTVEIVKKLCEDYGFIYFTTEQDYIQMKNSFLGDFNGE